MDGRRYGAPPVAVLAVAAIAVTTAFVVVLAALGLPLLPRGSATEEVGAVPAATPTARVLESPAAGVIATVLAPRGDAGLRGEDQWARTPAAPFAQWCPASRSEVAPLSRTRVFRVSGFGPVAVTASAYGAGQGVGAIAAFGKRMADCRSATFRAATYGAGDLGGTVASATPDASGSAPAATGSEPAATGSEPAATGSEPAATDSSTELATDTGVDAVVGWVTPASGGSSAAVLVWRRGDLVLSVLTAGAVTTRLAAIGQVFDARAVEALAPVCAYSTPSVDDVMRSPWQPGFFLGNLQPRDAPLVYLPSERSPTPSYPPGVTPVPVPQQTPLLPALPTETPSALPASVVPVPSPSPPQAPSPAPTSSVVGQGEADPVGPGCGWAFTAQGVPAFDSAAAAESFARRFAEAQASLRQLDAAWQVAKVTYAQEWAVYIAQAEAFSSYALEVAEQLALEQDSAYAAALEEWQAAKYVEGSFLASQEAARAAYEAALARCGETPSPLPSTTATEQESPTPTGSTSPTAEPSPSPAPQICPPPRPPILDQPVPTAPPSPTPPRG